MKADQIARVCYEANRAYATELGDHTRPPWDVLPDWSKKAIVEGVVSVLADLSMSPQKAHELWSAAKKKAGWKPGLVLAPDLLEHPNLVPWEDLSAEEKVKDYLFLSVVRALTPWTTEALGAALILSEEPNDFDGATNDKKGKKKK